MSRNVSKKLLMLDRAIEAIKRDLPPDSLTALSPKQRNLVQTYRRTTEPLQQWLDHLNNVITPEILLKRAMLPSECTAIEAQEIYRNEMEIHAKQSRRRRPIR